VLAVALTVLYVWLTLVPSKLPADRRVVSVAVSTTGRWIAAGTAKGHIALWDQRRPAAPAEFHIERGMLNDLAFSPDEAFLAVAAGRLDLWPTTAPSGPPRPLRSDDRNYGTVRFSSDGRTLLTISGNGTIQALDGQSGRTRLTICCSTVYGEVAFSPDGRLIVNAGHWPALWDAHTGKLVTRLTKSREFFTFRPIAFDDARGWLFMGSQDGRVYAWNVQTGRLMTRSDPQSDYVDTLTVLKNGAWVAYAGFGKAVRLWNPDSGEERVLPSARPTSNMAGGPDGTTLLFGVAQHSIEFWDTGTGQMRRTLKLPD